MKGKWTPAVVFALMLLAFLPPLVWRLKVMDGHQVIITPPWERRVLALAIVTPLIPAVGLIVAAVRRTLRLWVVMPLVGLLLLGTVGGGALMTVLTDFIFADKLIRTEPIAPRSGSARPQVEDIAPNGAQTTEPEELYLYDSSFLGCRLKVYAARPGSLYARLVLEENIDCKNIPDVHARWAADGGVESVDGGYTPINLPGLFAH